MRNAMWVGGGITGMGEIPMLGVKEKGIAKVIRDIFRNGEKGFFYDPSYMGAVYQDAIGSTAVSATGQPVGLMLDKSKGLSLLPHSLQPVLSLSGTGVAEIRPDNTFYIMRGSAVNSGAINIPTSPNKWYKLVIEILSGSPISIRTGLGISVHILQLSHGKLSLFVNMASFDYLRFVNMLANQEAVFKIHSLDELKGNHAFQTTSAARPILQQTPILGSEVIQDTGFNDSAYWNVSPTVNVSGGFANFVGAATGNSISRANKVTLGKTYQLTFTITSISSGSVRPSISTGGGAPIFGNFNKVGTHTVSGIASGVAPTIQLTAIGSTTATVDNISVKEVIGYLTDQNYIEYDGVDDKLITNLPAQLNNCTILRAIPNVGTQVKYNQTLPMLYEDSTNHSGLIAIDRALTRSEQLRLMTELDKRAGATSFDTTTFKMFDPTQQGFYYDPNDLSTMFQDSAGTIPVTSVGQPVGLIKDKSGKDNRAYQTVSASRPVLGRHPTSGLRNILRFNTNPLESVWSANGMTKTGGKLDSRDTYTAVEFKGMPAGVTTIGAKAPATDFVTFTVCLKAGTLTRANILLRNSTRAEDTSCTVDLLTGSVLVYAGNLPTVKSKSNGFWEISITSSKEVTIGDNLACYYALTSIGGLDENTSFTADYCQLERGNSATNIQVTTTAFDTTEEGFDNTHYLYFDGVDDFLRTSDIDFTGTDKVSLFTGVRKFSDAVQAVLVELSSAWSTNAGSFAILAPSYVGGKGYTSAARLSVADSANQQAIVNAGYTSPVSSVITSLYAADTRLRIDGQLKITNTANKGSGNYGNYPLYIGRRGGGSIPLNGHIYGLIGIGKLVSDTETAAIEKELAKRTGVTLNV